MLENLDVVFRSVAPPFEFVDVVKRAHECDKLTWNDPIEISIFDLLVVLVLLVVEFLELIPSEFDGEFKAFKAMLDCAGITALLSIRSVSKRHKL
jgi:hypothetical protein